MALIIASALRKLLLRSSPRPPITASYRTANVAGVPTAGVMKDVVMIDGYQTMDIDFIANDPGLTLFHCHQQLHMDFGFMALFDYV
jgi:FtsP/CotA-like multicopper oxidase with cupredoxin domain